LDHKLIAIKGPFSQGISTRSRELDHGIQTDFGQLQDSAGRLYQGNPVRSRYLNVNDLHISLQLDKDEGRRVVAVIKLRELIVRREDILAGVRNEVRDKLEELVKTPLATS
jgi:hypothetical protein